MWEKLPKEQKNKYEKLLTSFSSLSEAFAQKAEENEIIAPIVNSKFQETAFQQSFNANAEDIANTSYDASIDREVNGLKTKYLVGIKTFGITSGDQKIAQFKSISANSWIDIIDEIRANAKDAEDKKTIDKLNHKLYLQLAKKIADVRNKRIEAAKEILKGFNVKDNNVNVEAVYHVLMPSPKNSKPEINVGETSYSTIDIDNIKIVGCTSVKNPTNFKFSDGVHLYKYTSADSQLLMNFNNKDIVLDTWPVNYVDDAFGFFENLSDITKKKDSSNLPNKTYESHSWYLDVKPYSGFNAFYGQPKMPRSNNARENRIKSFKEKYEHILTPENLNKVITYLSKILLTNWNTNESKSEMVSLRENLMEFVTSIGNNELTNDIVPMVFRPANELEIRIPKSLEFHRKFPNFFRDNMNNNFIPGTNDLTKNTNARTFLLRFMPSKDVINAYINQQSGKAIESKDTQSILGKWILRDVFQLAPYKPLTEQRMDELGINGIRLTKINEYIQLEFIWIDEDDEPDDIWNSKQS